MERLSSTGKTWFLAPTNALSNAPAHQSTARIVSQPSTTDIHLVSKRRKVPLGSWQTFALGPRYELDLHGLEIIKGGVPRNYKIQSVILWSTA